MGIGVGKATQLELKGKLEEQIYELVKQPKAYMRVETTSKQEQTKPPRTQGGAII